MIKNTKIYLVTNCFGDPNKVYIGKTVNSRKYPHKKTFGKQIKYNYIDEISSLDKKDWKPLESFWIVYFKFLGFEVLNKNEGGQGPSFYSNESKQKISKSLLKGNHPRYYTQEVRDKISKGNKGISRNKGINKPKGFGEQVKKRVLGRKHSDTEKELMSKNRTGKLNYHLRKPVLQFDLNNIFIKEWEYVLEASKELKIRSSDICNCCIGNQNTASGFIWKYKNSI